MCREYVSEIYTNGPSVCVESATPKQSTTRNILMGPYGYAYDSEIAAIVRTWFLERRNTTHSMMGSYRIKCTYTACVYPLHTVCPRIDRLGDRLGALYLPDCKTPLPLDYFSPIHKTRPVTPPLPLSLLHSSAMRNLIQDLPQETIDQITQYLPQADNPSESNPGQGWMVCSTSAFHFL